MLSRACIRGFGLQSVPKRQAYQIAKRSVTTDAASSHAEKADVPEVSDPDGSPIVVVSDAWARY